MAQHQREFVCVPDQMAGFFILAASEPRQRFLKPSSETCCSNDSYLAMAAGTDWPFLSGLQGFRTKRVSRRQLNVLGQDTMVMPDITIDGYELDVVEQFTYYIGSTITDKPQTDREDQDGSVQCLCRQHTGVRKRDVDHIC